MACCLFAITLYAAYSYQRYVYPYDEVQLDIHSLPLNTSFVCLVATTDAGPTVVNWTHTNMLGGRAAMHPDSCSISSVKWYTKWKLSHEFSAPVQWIYSQRIGILIKTADGQWNVSWFGKDKTELKGHSLLFGRGSVAFDVSNADETEPMSTAQLEKLGMKYSLAHDD
jgi:hypothetical protein